MSPLMKPSIAILPPINMAQLANSIDADPNWGRFLLTHYEIWEIEDVEDEFEYGEVFFDWLRSDGVRVVAVKCNEEMQYLCETPKWYLMFVNPFQPLHQMVWGEHVERFVQLGESSSSVDRSAASRPELREQGVATLFDSRLESSLSNVAQPVVLDSGPQVGAGAA